VPVGVGSRRLKAIAQQLLYGGQLVRTVEPRHGRPLPHDVVRRDGRPVLDPRAIDGYLPQTPLRHIAHDLDREPGRRLGALGPCRVPVATRLDVVRHTAYHEALAAVDAGTGDL